MSSCPSDCTCRGSADSTDWGQELLSLLADVKSQRVRQNLIAWHTADQLTCPHCHVGPGQPCVTFPRGRNATFTHMKRVNARLKQLEK